MRAIKGVLAALAVWVAVSAASAQTGGLKVVVLDGADKSPLPGAIVTLSSQLGYVKETSIQTDVDGVAMFPVLRPGDGYRIKVLMSDYTDYDSGFEIRVKIGAPLTWQIPMLPTLKEVVKVEGRSEVVDLAENAQTTSFGSEFIQDLPVPGRFYQNVLTLAPGVDDSDGDGNPNVMGGREVDFKASVSGVSNQDPLTGGFASLVNPDSIEEIEVITSGAGVEYGGAQGGFANIVQKQGSNDFEGVANLLFRSSLLDGNGADGTIQGDKLQSFKQYQPAIQLSGPIIRDKLWYRLSHEYHYIDQPVNTIGTVALFTTRRKLNDDLVTWQASPRNKLQFQYRSDPSELSNIGVTSLRGPDSAEEWTREGPTYVFTWDAPYSTALLVHSLVSWQDNHYEFNPTSEGVQNDCVSGVDGIAESLAGAYCQNATTGQVSGSFNRTWKDDRQRLTVKSDAEHFATKLWGFDQRIKFGFQVENERYARDLTARPRIFFFKFTPNPDESGSEAELDPVGLALTQFSIPQSSFARATGVKYALFGQDQVSLTSSLTATVGLRVDREDIQAKGKEQFDPAAQSQRYADLLATCTDPAHCIDGLNQSNLLPLAFTAFENIADLRTELSRILGVDETQIELSSLTNLINDSWYRRRQLSNIDISNTNLSPFLAVNWDPFRDGKTKVSGTLGRHYDHIFLGVPLNEMEPASFFTRIETRYQDGEQVIPPGAFGSIAPTNADIVVVDRNLQTPYQDELTLAFERELWQETSVRFTYIKRKFKDQFQDIDINHAPGDYGRCLFGDTGWGVSPSPGQGEQMFDPWTNTFYTDNDPGPGDGRIDDCNGDIELIQASGGDNPPPGGSNDRILNEPDGVPDAYLLNPSFGSIYLVGNYNTADFVAYVLELTRRQYKGWQMEASYTYSRAVGDAEAYNTLAGDDLSNQQYERGYLSYDRRHGIKVNATTITPWGFRVGTAVNWLSGLPYSQLVTRLAVDSLPPTYAELEEQVSPRVRLVYPTRQRNDMRNRSYWNVDVNAAKEFNLKGGLNLQLRAEIFNLFNSDYLYIQNNIDGNNDSFRDFGRTFQISGRLAF
jgi:outer membrane receptor protein involved in Fe transport